MLSACTCNVAMHAGRIELECIERGQTDLPEHADAPPPEDAFDAGSVYDTPSESTLTVQLHWQKAVKVEIPGDRDPGHGGGDQRLLDDIFIGSFLSLSLPLSLSLSLFSARALVPTYPLHHC